MMIFFDSVTAPDIPVTARGVMGYVDGGPGIMWANADWARFPNATKIRIATHAATDDGDMGDVESTDMLPTEAPVWVALRRASGQKPWWWPPYVYWPLLYVNKGNWDAVQAAMRARGLITDYVVADPYPDGMEPGAPHQILGALGVQFAWAAQSNQPQLGIPGGHYDLTLMPDSFDPDAITRAQLIQVVWRTQAEFKEDNLYKVSVKVPPLDDQGNGSILVPGAAGRVVSVIVNGNDPNREGYDGITPAIETSARGADELVVFQKSKPHAGFDVKVWVAGPEPVTNA